VTNITKFRVTDAARRSFINERKISALVDRNRRALYHIEMIYAALNLFSTNLPSLFPLATPPPFFSAV
jgi:hypothetical protein